MIHLQGIFVDENGMVAEGPNMNLGIITHENELVVRRLHAFTCDTYAVQPERASHACCLTSILLVPSLTGRAKCMQVPTFESSLPGITILTLMELVSEVSVA